MHLTDLAPYASAQSCGSELAEHPETIRVATRRTVRE
jgi:hypothetical protein